MKISRKDLRNLIESVIYEQNPGNKFSAAVKKGKSNKIARIRKRATEELQKTYDWFENVVFPAVENNNWPIVVDDNYFIGEIDGLNSIKDGYFTNSGNFIPKGTKITSVNDGFRIGGNELTQLGHVYSRVERSVINNDLRVTMQSAQELPEEIKAAKKASPQTRMRK